MKRYIIILLALMLGLALQAEVHSNAGKYGYKFLDIPVSPVSMALAGRGIHSPANSSAWLTQPAATCMQNAKSAAVSHSAWIAETAIPQPGTAMPDAVVIWVWPGAISTMATSKSGMKRDF